ncbi:hypothetical protein B9Z55_001507 [Caenorhabditis nigoni]|uniref:Uncharacterized protein n=1 Tax=Caenorhabditis nigoni TaxID=1611254 RepID=A0A2G5VG14_9PELO|nr:hypothetical protein B9Z55_001507 [Caenorhabditis nigoni]
MTALLSDFTVKRALDFLKRAEANVNGKRGQDQLRVAGFRVWKIRVVSSIRTVAVIKSENARKVNKFKNKGTVSIYGALWIQNANSTFQRDSQHRQRARASHRGLHETARQYLNKFLIFPVIYVSLGV